MNVTHLQTFLQELSGMSIDIINDRLNTYAIDTKQADHSFQWEPFLAAIKIELRS